MQKTTLEKYFSEKYFFRCRHGLHRLRAIMHPHPLLFRSRGENLLQNNFSFLSFSVKITFVSQAFPGQVHCSTSKHKDCWKRRAKKTGDFFTSIGNIGYNRRNTNSPFSQNVGRSSEHFEGASEHLRAGGGSGKLDIF